MDLRGFYWITLLAMLLCLRAPLAGQGYTGWVNPEVRVEAVLPENPGEPVTAADWPDEGYDFSGFSVDKPNDENWVYNPVLTHQRYAAAFLYGEDAVDQEHSLWVHVGMQGQIDVKAAKTYLAANVDLMLRLNYNTTQREIETIRTELGERFGQPCVYFTRITKEKEPVGGKDPVFYYERGFVVVHPEYNNSVILIYYTERGSEAQIKNRLFAERASEFIKGITLQGPPAS